LHEAAILPEKWPAQNVAIFKPFLLISGWAPGLVRLARFMAFGNRYLPPIFALTADRQKSIFQLILADCFPAVYN
jgi:hypothetical protein